MKNIIKITAFTLIPSIIIALACTVFLKDINANLTLQISIPFVFFLVSCLGFWLIYNLLELYVFKRRGRKGFELRGKITANFLLSTLGFLVLLGVMLFYLIFLIESSFVERERKIAEDLLKSYQAVSLEAFSNYENKMKKKLFTDLNPPLASFILKNGKPEFSFHSDANAVLFFQNQTHFTTNLKDGSLELVGTNFLYSVLFSKKFFFVWETDSEIREMKEKLGQFSASLQELWGLKRFILPVSLVSLIILSIPILAGVFLVSFRVARNITVPVEEIARGTRILAKGKLDYRLKIRREDEIGNLAVHFNEMAEKLKLAYQQIKRMERLEAWQEVARRLAHEVKNPLTPIKLSAERLIMVYENKPSEFPQTLKKTTDMIIMETKRLENLVNEFSRFARLPDLKKEKADIVAIVREVTEFFQNAYSDIHFEIRFWKEEFVLLIDSAQIKQVLHNLITNAVEACEGYGKSVIISSELRENSIRISIRDTGVGIPSEAEEMIFEPYFTTKKNGSGLGLAISERIIQEHGGTIWFQSKEDGTEFFLELPLMENTNGDEA